VSRPQAFRRDEGRYLIHFIDDRHLGQAGIEQMRAAIGPFLAEGLHDSDRVTLIAPENGVYWTSRSAEEHRRLPGVLERLESENRFPFGTGVGHSVGSTQLRRFDAPLTSPQPAPMEAEHIARLAAVSTLSGLRDVLERLGSVPGRKSLLLYSDSFVHDRGEPAFDLVIDLARRSNVVIEFVDTRGLPVHPIRSTGGPGYLAWATGGRTTVSNDYTEAVQAVLRESSAYYLLGYEPPPGSRSDRHVDVRVRRPGLEVRARRRYSLGPAGPTSAD
jgi:VWFA-related protein